jgi:5-methylcytosine-specific restriction enzyme subunit McrC
VNGSTALQSRIAITCSEWTAIDPVKDPRLEGATLSLVDSGTAGQLSQSGVMHVSESRHGLTLETFSFIGRVVLGPLEVTIVPKIAWRRWLNLFGYAFRLRDVVRSETSDLDVSQASLQDLIASAAIAEARELLGRGLHRNYVEIRKAIAAPRGRIDFGGIARGGGITEAAIPCRYTRRSDDSVLNRTVLAGMNHVVRVVRDPGLRNAARRIAQELEATVRSQPLTAALLSSARAGIDRRTTRYNSILRLITILYNGQSISLAGDESSRQIALRGFAFDMNHLWQRLLARVLTEWTVGVDLREEYQLRDIFSADPSYAPRRFRVPRPRPDYAVFRKQRLHTLLDAKYRDLWEKSLPRDMLYQLSVYAAAQGSGVVAMLYPTDSAAAGEERLRIHDAGSGEAKVAVALRPVHLEELERLITAENSAGRERERQEFAEYLLGCGPSHRTRSAMESSVGGGGGGHAR